MRSRCRSAGWRGHLAEMLGWAEAVVGQESFDISPPGAAPYLPPQLNTRRDVLELFDRNAASARTAIACVSDEGLAQQWSLLSNGRVVFAMPRLTVLRTLIINHTIHHRAQLGVYLRLNNVPVPATYGPSADEGTM